MLQKQSIIFLIDNTKAVFGQCIGFYAKKKIGGLGDLSLISIKKLVTGNKNIKKGELFKVLIVQTKKSLIRRSNISLLFENNQGILLTKDNKPIGSKVKGFLPKELRSNSFLRAGIVGFGFL